MQYFLNSSTPRNISPHFSPTNCESIKCSVPARLILLYLFFFTFSIWTWSISYNSETRKLLFLSNFFFKKYFYWFTIFSSQKLQLSFSKQLLSWYFKSPATTSPSPSLNIWFCVGIYTQQHSQYFVLCQFYQQQRTWAPFPIW